MAISNTKFYVIIPVFGAKRELIERCLGSLYLQSYKNFETLIVEDCSNFNEGYNAAGNYIENSDDEVHDYIKNFCVLDTNKEQYKALQFEYVKGSIIKDANNSKYYKDSFLETNLIKSDNNGIDDGKYYLCKHDQIDTSSYAATSTKPGDILPDNDKWLVDTTVGYTLNQLASLDKVNITDYDGDGATETGRKVKWGTNEGTVYFKNVASGAYLTTDPSTNIKAEITIPSTEPSTTPPTTQQLKDVQTGEFLYWTKKPEKADNSSDDEPQIVESTEGTTPAVFVDLEYLVKEGENYKERYIPRGPQVARNYGLNYLYNKNDVDEDGYVIFLDADDYLDTDYLSKMNTYIMSGKYNTILLQPTINPFEFKDGVYTSPARISKGIKTDKLSTITLNSVGVPFQLKSLTSDAKGNYKGMNFVHTCAYEEGFFNIEYAQRAKISSVANTDANYYKLDRLENFEKDVKLSSGLNNRFIQAFMPLVNRFHTLNIKTINGNPLDTVLKEALVNNILKDVKDGLDNIVEIIESENSVENDKYDWEQ